MNYQAATFPGVTTFDRRAAVHGGHRRTVVGSVAVGVGTVTAAGVTTGGAAVVAAWLMAASFAANPGLNGRSPIALHSSMLNRHYSLLSSAADFSGWAKILAPGDPAAGPASLAAEVKSEAAPETTGSVATQTVAAQTVAMETAAAGTVPASTLTPTRTDTFSLLTPYPLDGSRFQPPQDAARPAASAPPRSDAPSTPAVSASLEVPQRRVAPPPPRDNGVSLPGPDSHTAVYDIEAHVVYLPSGLKLEAHSGLGKGFDDPRYVKERNRGPTPPNVYDLKWREAMFHGVKAIRLNPVDDSKMFGRDGILAHTYMLGPNGASFGCVSFKNYSAFLQAFSRGEIDRLIVVPHLGAKSPVDERASAGNVERFALNSR
jgi:Protein of unknown function (DUF2778)